MPSRKKDYQEQAQLDDPSKSEIGAPEKELLRNLFGESGLTAELTREHLARLCVMSVASQHGLDWLCARVNDVSSPDVSLFVSLAKQWIEHHVPATQIEEISVLASVVIGDRDKAMRWLSEPNPAMDNRLPIDLVGEKEGYERVKNLLLRIEYGALA